MSFSPNPSRIRISSKWIRWIALCLPIVLMQLPSSAAITLRAEQIGDDVVITGSGMANLSGLSFFADNTSWTNLITDSQVYAGPDAFDDGNVSLYSGIIGPSIFGIDPTLYEVPDTVGSSGDLFGILADNGTGVAQLVLPLGYLSDSSLSGVTRYHSLTIAQLGLTPGQVSIWSWGSGENTDSLRLEVANPATPVPGPAPFLGAVAAIHMARRLRSRLRDAASQLGR